MKFKVGDKVRVKSLEWYRNEFKITGRDFTFTTKMSELCGMVVTIKDILEIDLVEVYVIEEEIVPHYWQDFMFEDEVVTEEKEIIKEIQLMNNKVEHPKHYTSHPSGIECIDIARHYDFCIGNVIKYLWRSGLKQEQGYSSKEKQIEDLKKARFYLDYEIKMLETPIVTCNNIDELKKVLNED